MTRRYQIILWRPGCYIPTLCSRHLIYIGTTVPRNNKSNELHAAFANQNSASRHKCLEAGLAIILAGAAARILEFPFVDHGVAAMWAAVCRVMINEIITVRSLYLDPSVLTVPVLGEAELLAALDELQVAMAHFAPSSALMNYQLGRIQQERIAV
ncbi:unnamed protein product [Peniophora sp. CBMAI 1063]|nr:unnamed protein product [Peniophora sp. CBMAI 1063]